MGLPKIFRARWSIDTSQKRTASRLSLHLYHTGQGGSIAGVKTYNGEFDHSGLVTVVTGFT